MARFYAACLASYNAGRLYGAWIDLDTDTETMGEAVQAMLKASPVRGAEEWAVHDYDGVPSSLGEYPGLDGLAAAAELLEAAEEQVGEGGAYDLAKAVLDNFGGRTDEALKRPPGQLPRPLRRPRGLRRDHAGGPARGRPRAPAVLRRCRKLGS